MKKIFLISLLATALFTSCSDEVINTLDGNTIRFENAFVEQPETRATDLTTNNLDLFYVHGWMTNAQGQTANIFDKVEVRKNGSGVWAYDGGGRYWFGNTKYEFLAFASNLDECNAEYTLADDHKSLTFTNRGDEDFIFAAANRNIEVKVPTYVDPVALSFNHMLAKVLIQFKNEFTEDDVTLNVEKLELSGMAKTADLNLETNEWATPTDKSLVLYPGFHSEKINRNVSDTLIAAGKTANTEHFYLIPENIDYEVYRLDFEVTVLQGEKGQEIQIGKYHHSVAFDKMKFQMGKQYRVLAKLNSSNVNPDAEIKPITFTVEVLPWGQDIEGEINIGN